MKKEQIVVVAAIIERGGKYLITQRPAGKHLAGKWEFPGGVVEFGEDPKNRLITEIKEELDGKVHVISLFDYSSFIYEDKRHIILLALSCYLYPGPIRKIGVKDYKWVRPEKMVKYDFCEADIIFVQKLQKMAPK